MTSCGSNQRHPPPRPSPPRGGRKSRPIREVIAAPFLRARVRRRRTSWQHVLRVESLTCRTTTGSALVIDCLVIQCRFIVLGLLLIGSSPLFAADSAAEFELKDGDRVVTLGGTLKHHLPDRLPQTRTRQQRRRDRPVRPARRTDRGRDQRDEEAVKPRFLTTDFTDGHR